MRMRIEKNTIITLNEEERKMLSSLTYWGKDSKSFTKQLTSFIEEIHILLL